MNFDFRSEDFKRKYNLILLVYKLMTECFIEIGKIIPKQLLNREIWETGLKFNPELELIGL